MTKPGWGWRRFFHGGTFEELDEVLAAANLKVDTSKLYLNGWFPAIFLNGETDISYHFHAASKVVQQVGEWMWVGRAGEEIGVVGRKVAGVSEVSGTRRSARIRS